jgi:hypothetical protein
VGAAALEGRTGVIKVKKGWRGSSEVDRVTYDEEQVNVHQLEDWLKKANTYIRTVQPERQELQDGSH